MGCVPFICTFGKNARNSVLKEKIQHLVEVTKEEVYTSWFGAAV